MIGKYTKKTPLYLEMEEEDRRDFFDFKDRKFIHNIDSLYYVVKVKNDWNHDEGVSKFTHYLSLQKKKANKSYDPVVLFQGNNNLVDLGSDFVMNGIGSSPYLYDIEKKDKFLIFVMQEHALNSKTPELWVQIRSQFLWLHGEYKAVEESLKDIERILAKFDIEIEEVKENRIDFAYHTNYIQDLLTFFKVSDLNRMQESRFSRYSLEGKFIGEFDIDTDYVTLGRKKSNNTFFRAYNKTKEVIEQGYKQFFLQVWLLEGLINRFDFYCIEKAFLKGNYNYLDVARLEFYLEYGTDQQIKEEIKDLIEVDSPDYDEIRAYANKVVPKVTLVTNIEIETKRKFYYSMDNSVEMLLKVKSKGIPDYARKLYVKLDNKQVFHNYLTKNNTENDGVIRFLDYKAKNKLGKPWTRKAKFPTASWWTRLQSVKVNRRFEHEDVQLLREYQKTLDLEKMKKRAMNSISTYKLYLNHDNIDTSVDEDVLDFLATINESDIEKAIEYKQKKFTQLKARLIGTDKTDTNGIYRLINLETGEFTD